MVSAMLSVLVAIAALPLAVLASPAAIPITPMRQDMRGLNRLWNSTLAGRAIFPSGGIRGVNVGAWFVFEPYMAIDEWSSMGGEQCGDCTTCASDEFSLTRKLGQTQANTAFAKHWSTFITQDDVNLMKQYGINSVRIPIGFWIIESTVLSNETYPRGGLNYLRAGCKMFRNAGISVLLDLHAAPGAQVSRNPFAGRCVATPGFWNQANFDRMNNAAAQLTTLIHNEPDNFGSVWGLEALNEPPTDTNDTPGYFTFMQGFVNAVRGAENSLGIADANRISAVFMDISWQWGNPQNAANPAFAENGGNAYDSHLYYSFGAPCGPNGCVSGTLSSHINFACTGGGGRIQADSDQLNTPSFLGEWWLLPLAGTFGNFDQTSARAFGDAQKRGYSPEGGRGGFGWYFWSWKMTNSDSDGSNHMRSYKDAVAQGYLPSNAASYFNANICS
ncbi:glycoside hydrolase [Exidia glandulosa HHB12029]|uniref:glucan 1,3-beta-glucosidase n=1 Tax=Exidia glandulosa HHB12029 TaxID=1314781 RepID=A0A165Z4F3_EXIGL|nr:glycoside hydrolase [Exidia glandulosa HHB12029]